MTGANPIVSFRHILVLDDQEEIAGLVLRCMAPMQVRVTASTTLDAAYEAVAFYDDIDTVMVDASVEGGIFDTRLFVEWLARKEFAGLIIGMSSKDMEADMVAAGCQQFVSKPMGLLEFLRQGPVAAF